jgi:hypothetical protein
MSVLVLHKLSQLGVARFNSYHKEDFDLRRSTDDGIQIVKDKAYLVPTQAAAFPPKMQYRGAQCVRLGPTAHRFRG